MKKIIAHFTILNIILALIASIYICYGWKFFSAPNTETTIDRVSVDKNGQQQVTSEKASRITEIEACNNDKSACISTYLVQSKIDDDLTLQFTELLKQIEAGEKENKPFCFLSGGGSASSALDISRLIRKYTTTTCMASRYYTGEDTIVRGNYEGGQGSFCFSACGFILMSAKNRLSVGDLAQIGVHKPARYFDFCWCRIQSPFGSVDSDSSSLVSIHTIIKETEDDKHQTALNNYLIDSYDTEHEAMRILNASELKIYNVFNHEII